MSEAFIFDAVRSPRGKGRSDGALHEITPLDLSAQVLASVRERNNLPAEAVEDISFGCVSPVGEQGAVITRTAALQAGYAETTSGIQVNRFCGSGLEASNIAAAKVKAGEADLTIGGGIESMSRVPMGSDGGAWPVDPRSAIANYFIPQGISADLIATKYGYSRDDVDAYAMESQKRAARAWAEKRFANSILPIRDVIGEVVLDHDELMRPETDMQSLGALAPAFAMMGQAMPGFDDIAKMRYPDIENINHVHHAGNSSGIVDGSAAVLIGNDVAAKKYDLKPRARIVSMASIGSEPTIMLTGPEFAAQKALTRAGMSASDIDLWELNEAFASVVLRFMDAMKVDHSDINVNGGAIAMGHPLGATGAMILGTVVDELERSGKSTALITLCIGAGMGTATIIERV
ncbi:acetyl-CoA acetyltransferase [Sphingorhabdus lutea]|uniref:Acetyl-CoA acetyltransferase n=1 Tax=Sphingorhabdus lutea TaxID=1913578 RepID=A0A1L3JDX3_9SPHN|nr:acetyl-CoA C-acetyltransferase [Sphingorhabdus lutea]APG63253.1 acetyl-CoA acetyltransferase [Sphingorhabdus lutea]